MLSKLSQLLLIREGERRQVLYFFLLYALVGCGMAFGRNSSNVLFLKRYGIEYLPIMYMAISVFLALISTLYAAFADRLSPERLLQWLFLGLIVLLLGNWAWISFSDASGAYPAYFLLYEVASELLVIHAAHYAMQNFDPSQAKRLLPLILAGNQIGIIIGSLVLAATARQIAIQDIPLAWGGMLLVAMYAISRWHRKHGSSFYFRAQKHGGRRLQQVLSQMGFGFGLLKQSRLLRASSLALFFMVISFYVLTYSINQIYTSHSKSEAALTSLYGLVTAATNTLALIFQVFVTNRAIQRFGVKKVNLLFPITTLITYVGLLASFSLVPAVFGSFNKKTVMAAFRNPIRTIFFNTLPDNIRGRARATTITLVLPLALFCCGLLLTLTQGLGNPLYYLAIGLAAAVLYLFFNLKMNRSYEHEMLSTLKNKLLITSPSQFDTGSERFAEDTGRFAKSTLLNRHILRLFDLLIASKPEQAQQLLLSNADQDETRIADQIIGLLAPINPMGFVSTLRRLYEETGDAHLQASILNTLFSLADKKSLELIPELLASPNPRLVASGIGGAVLMNHQVDEALSSWQRLLEADELTAQISALSLLETLRLRPDLQAGLIPLYKQAVFKLLQKASPVQLKNLLLQLQNWPEAEFPELAPRLLPLFEASDSAMRVACVRCARLFYRQDQALLALAIEDSNEQVRHEAARVHYLELGKEGRDTFIRRLSSQANGSPRAQSAYLGLLLEHLPRDPCYEGIASSKTDSAGDFLAAGRILETDGGQHSAAYQVVIHVLKERVREHIDLAILALQGVENAEALDIVRTGFNSNDPRHIANACEILRGLDRHGIGKRIADIMDRQESPHKRQAGTGFGDNAQTVLAWCRGLAEPWLSHCATQALKSVA